MILYIFNHPFPDNSGFGKRCQKEIEILAKKEKLIVLFRSNNISDNKSIQLGGKTIRLEPFSIKSRVIERADAYKSGLYEIVRNFDLLIGLSSKLIKVLWRNRKEKNIKLYVINSPLTVSAISYIVAKIFQRDPHVVEFHDVEPELAKDIKKLPDENVVMKVTYFLERFVCKAYKKIVVTSQSQADKIIERTQVASEKVYLIPNSINIVAGKNPLKSKELLYKQYNLQKKDVILVYSSNLSYDYTINGMLLFLKELPRLLITIPNIKVLIMGEGEGKTILEKNVKKLQLDNHVIFSGKIANPEAFLSIASIAFIPWERNELTETILPTKLFDYMVAKKTIIAPNFGEFKNVLKHNYDSFLYNSTKELLQIIKTLNNDQQLNKKIGNRIYKKYMRQYNPNIYEKHISTLLNYD